MGEFWGTLYVDDPYDVDGTGCCLKTCNKWPVFIKHLNSFYCRLIMMNVDTFYVWRGTDLYNSNNNNKNRTKPNMWMRRESITRTCLLSDVQTIQLKKCLPLSSIYNAIHKVSFCCLTLLNS